ncbi:MAG: hypothetical protein A3J74_05090 [Elusimicrobia bacterium RIFCSPHIGHO2_02_FULL_57_9]|nr:MAG: hypothetical protein A3J74_05090 [Elusimicrobia bacterium RIFCSPHIGHO2_02_FULL_57_9]
MKACGGVLVIAGLAGHGADIDALQSSRAGWRAASPAALLLLFLLLVTLPAPVAAQWSSPTALVDAQPRVAVGNRVHLVGHTGGNLVHRSSQDGGATWSAATTIAPGGTNYPMQYGGLYAVGDTVYLLTAADDMGAENQHLDFRKSTSNGTTWSSPVRITGTNREIRRANILAAGESVHVLGLREPGAQLWYFRSTNGGTSWSATLLDGSAGTNLGWIDAVGTTLHVAYTQSFTMVAPSRIHYLRSTNNGDSWSSPVLIDHPQSDRGGIRPKIKAADGRLLVIWNTLLTPRDEANEFLGGNRSNDSGTTWEGAQTIIGPQGTAAYPNHPDLDMVAGGVAHLAWGEGATQDAAGYAFSLDYGASWSPRETAISVGGEGNMPFNVRAGTNWVHVVTVSSKYVRRQAPGSSDTSPPTVSLTAPSNGATVSGTVAVTATATDNIGVAGVQFKLDGTNLGAELTSPPYSAPFNSTLSSNGSHALTAVARDAAGNTTTSAAVTITVNNPATAMAPAKPRGLRLQ